MEVASNQEPPTPGERRLVGWFVRHAFRFRRRAGPWPVPDWLQHERLRIEGNTGADLAARWFPAADARGVVVLAHPDRRYGQHWFVNVGWLDFLRDAGFHVLTFDFPDYGESRGGSTYYYEDVVAAARYAHARELALPLHVVGVSLGAFAVANASPYLDFADALVLESPYPSFNAWYGRGVPYALMKLFDRLFPRTAARIQAPQNLARAAARRILVVAAGADEVTAPPLTRTVADAGPPDRTTYLELPGLGHLQPFVESAEYRDAVLSALGVRRPPARNGHGSRHASQSFQKAYIPPSRTLPPIPA